MQTIEIKGEIGWDIGPADLKASLAGVTGDIYADISTPGGYIIPGVEMFNMLREYDKGKVICRNVGQAASMGSYLMLAGDEAEAFDNATYMIHNAIAWAFGNHHDLRDTADTMEALTMMLAKEYVNKTGKSIEEIKELLDKETYFFGEEMLEHGFVDRIVSTDKEKDRAAAVAVASESFKACAISTQEHHADVKPEQVAAILKGQMKQFENTPAKSTKGETMDYSKLTMKLLKDNCPEMVADIETAAFNKGTEEGKTAGVKAEAERIAAIDAESMPGHEALITKMKADPTKTAVDAKLAIFDAMKATLKKAGEDRAEDGVNLASTVQDITTTTADDAETKEAEAKAKAKKAGDAMLKNVKKKG